MYCMQARYELQIISLQAEKDKQDIESERARLRSLIGNVAHDLKTPLQSIGEHRELNRKHTIKQNGESA